MEEVKEVVWDEVDKVCEEKSRKSRRVVETAGKW